MRKVLLAPILSALAATAILAADPAAAALPRDYPARGKAVEALKPAADYSPLTKERPRSVAIMRARAHGFVPSPELQAYVQSVLTRILTGVPLPPTFNADVRVLAAPDFGAVCTPDGTIVVSMGLLTQVESEDELAFILAHEVSHAILRHHASDWFTKSQYYAVVSAQSLSNVAQNLQQTAQQNGQNVGQGINFANIGRGIDLAQKIYTLSESVLAPQFQQGQEDQADALGLDLMIKAGYSPAGAGRALEHLAAAEEAGAAAAAAAQQAQKANAPQRPGGGLGSMLGGLAAGALTGQGPQLSNLSTQDFLTLGSAALDAATDTLAKDAKAHRAATQRNDLIGEYQFREYRDLVPGDLQPLAWGRTDPLGRQLVTLLTNYRAADAVGDYLQAAQQPPAPGARPPSIADADRAATFAVRPPTENHAYTMFPVSKLRQAERKQAEAVAARTASLRSPEPSWIVYNTDIDEKLAARNFAGADTTMTDAVARFENSPVLLPKRITILRGLGREPEARQLVGQCGSYDIRELKTQCDNALAGK